jgi:peptide/nickel transport system ATP-binding protein
LPVIADFMDEKPDGTLVEKAHSVATLIDSVTVSPEQTRTRLEELQQRTPMLKVRNLKTWFPSKRNILGQPQAWVKAVDDVSFDVYPGETLGLVGESGCGKTTLGRTIIRLVDAHDGSMELEGRDLIRMNKRDLTALRKDMQIIFQDPYSSLNPRLTIGNAILEPLNVHQVLGSEQERKARVLELLDRVGLQRMHYNRYPHEFSGGQRQRICIARALALNPRFIICDESVSALDVSVQAQVLNLLIELRKDFNFTYIFISHDLSVVKFMSDRMVVMNKGKIEEMGPADEIYNNPQHPYTQKLIDAIPKGELEDIMARLAVVRG